MGRSHQGKKLNMVRLTRNRIIRIGILLLGIWCAGSGWAAEPVSMSLTVDGKERVCLDCHRRPNIQSNEGAFASQALCFECHAREGLTRKRGETVVSLKVTPESFAGSRHQVVACIACHSDVARSPHRPRFGSGEGIGLHRCDRRCRPPPGDGCRQRIPG